MLTLSKNDIRLSQSAKDKVNAIQHIAQDLVDKGFVDQGYAQGMLNREQQNSTFLGNGIAIPHGTTDTRSQVKTTGVAVHHFPNGVDWGDGNTVFVAIGIAATSDEHLGILKQLTKVLGAEGVEQRLRDAKSEEDIIALLHGEVQLEAHFDSSLVALQFPAADMVQLTAVAAGLLKNAKCANLESVADLISKAPTHLGSGLWLIGTDKQVPSTGMAFVSVANSFEFAGENVKALMAFAACNNSHQALLKQLTQRVFNKEQDKLLQGTPEQLVALLKGEEMVSADDGLGNSGVFRIKNAHGLHARPGAVLVATVKKFESSVKVANLDGDGTYVNAKSLMKVIALGVKHGHQLQFVAEGSDAKEAIDAIDQVIQAGLGEG